MVRCNCNNYDDLYDIWYKQFQENLDLYSKLQILEYELNDMKWWQRLMFVFKPHRINLHLK